MLTQWVLKLNDSIEKGLGRIDSKVASTIGKFEKLQGRISNVGAVSEKSFGLVKSAVVGAASALLTIGLADVGRQMFDLAATNAKYNAVLTNTFQSATQAASSMAMIKDLAATTPFQVNELTSSYIKLVNQGFVPTRNQLENLGDLASAVGKPFDQLAEAVLDAQTFEFERLKEFGVRAEKHGNKIAFTFKGVTTEVDAQSASIQRYLIGLGDMQGVAGSMASIMETPIGKLSNLRDNFDSLLTQLGTKLMPTIISVFEVLNKGISWVANNGGVISAFFVGAAVAASYYAASLIGAKIGTLALTLATEGLSAAFTATPIGLIITAVGLLAAGIYMLWERSETFRAVIKTVWEPFAWIIEKIYNGFSNLIENIGLLASAIKSKLAPVKDFIVDFLLAPFKAVYDIVLGLLEVTGLADKFRANLAAERGAGAVASGTSRGDISGGISAGFTRKGKSSAASALKDGLKGVSDGTKQVRNITVNIKSLIENFSVQTTNMNGMSREKIKETVTEVLLRAVNGAELQMSNG